MSVGTNIRYYRKINNLSQQELADKLGVTNKAISSWEKDRTEPNMGYVNEMCRIFGCNASNISEKPEVPEYDEDTMELIDLFSKITKEQKQTVLAMLRSFMK